MRIVGLTGNIGSGKSTVIKFFQALDYDIISADDLSKKAIQSKSIQKRIILEFGKSIENLNGSLNRQKLAEIIFSDVKKLNTLNQIVHPKVKNLFYEELKNLYKRKKNAFVVYEVPLLFEVNMQSSFQKTILVTSDENLMISRKAAQTGLSPSHIKKRLSFQMNVEHQKKKANFIIDNQKSLENTKKKISILSQKLQKLKELNFSEIKKLVKNPEKLY